MKTRTCKTCNKCKPAYGREWYWIYHKKPYYYCTECEQMTDRESICEKWQSKKAEYDITPQRLKEAEEDIKFLIELFKNE